MKTKPLTFLLSLTFLFFFNSSFVVFANDFQNGLDAYNKQDYETAHKLFSQLEEKGYANAQYNLGVMYVEGKGILQDYKEAVKWYRLSETVPIPVGSC